MSGSKDYLKDITEIRSMMERSSRFISLSGLSGVFAGTFAIIGALIAYFYLDLGQYRQYFDGVIQQDVNNYSENSGWVNAEKTNTDFYLHFIRFCIVDAIIVLTLSLLVGYWFTSKKAKQQGLSVWDKSAKQLLIHLAIPLITGGLFCVILLSHGLLGLVAPVSLVFYGLALINAGKFTLNEVRYLGVCQIILGLVSSYFIGYGFIAWVIGFGILHILYGSIMYFKYER